MKTGASVSVVERLGRPYQGYVYSYPHKSAYGAFDRPKPIRNLWSQEQRDQVFLYLHLPFCEMRCGFCNLFTTANPSGSLVKAYLQALKRQAEMISEEATDWRAARLAVGGGTPTYLLPQELSEVLDLVARHYAADPAKIPSSVETSPKTATRERLQLLSERGVQRISIGAQSFVDAEARSMGRPQKCADLERALDEIRLRDFGCLNIDLIYGAAGQTPESWRGSLRRALDWYPEEIYLYPLYVRPLTALDGRTEVWDNHRLGLYRTGRDLLLQEGYEQISMRMFRRPGTAAKAGPDYCCQEDGMLGLGAGARSYTNRVHYSTEYAVARGSVLAILQSYCEAAADSFRAAWFGAALDREEQARRYVLKSILRTEGLDGQRFKARFDTDPLTEFWELRELLAGGCLATSAGRLVPTDKGLELSDAIGPWLYSQAVLSRMKAYEAA